VDENKVTIKGKDDASEAQWFPISFLPKLAFDHQDILNELLNGLSFE